MVKKPRIFINMHYMALGGAERALLGLLNALDTDRVDVDLFLNQHTGEFMSQIPAKINLLPERRGYNAIEHPMLQIVREGQLCIAWARFKARRQHARYHQALTSKQQAMDSSIFQYVMNAVDSHLPSLDDLGEYDLAISFLQPHNIVLHKVRARKKICWIHTDYSTVHVNAEQELPIWSGYDHVVSISPDCTRAFLKTFPSLAGKIIEIENILSPSLVRQNANAFDALPELGGDDSLIIISIGRYCHQKNFDNVPDICKALIAEMKRLLSVGLFTQAKNYDNVPDICRRVISDGSLPDVHWFIIGFGGDEALIRQRIVEAGMERHVHILGKRDNPYPYIKACDIYVQPSRYEGKSVTVREAQILCKPVAVTAYPTATSQVIDGVDGVILPMDNAGCAQGLARFIANTALQRRIVDHLKTHDYSNEPEVNKIYHLLNI